MNNELKNSSSEEKQTVETYSTFFLNNVFAKYLCSYHGMFNDNYIYEKVNESFYMDIEEEGREIDLFKEYLKNKLDAIEDKEIKDLTIKDYEMMEFLQNFINHDYLETSYFTNYETDFIKIANESIIELMDIGIFSEMKYLKVNKPREYNFVADSFDYELSYNVSIKDLQTEFIKVFNEYSNNDDIKQSLKDNFHSRSGFISFVEEYSSFNSIFEMLNDSEDFGNNLDRLTGIYLSLKNWELFADDDNDIFQNIADISCDVDFFLPNYSILYELIEEFKN